ncbi:hypothetical protein QQF45_03520 [Halopseudomonas aestusnigri]|uniref:hypothetical protein n=1 Tax=Halopseudomonas aestusnigri TaxID=857252 RepID=UPI0025524CF4|nr:hypothetical protein [Halopseudomonas aestusnigri]MDL2198131.1 hypothetical protein [Halopseudomonas aestusnigri]
MTVDKTDQDKTEFDADYESRRLAMLALQFPEHADGRCEVRFAADDEARLSHASWSTDVVWFVLAGDSGFKTYLLELLDSFIRYRAQYRHLPWKSGIVYIDSGSLRIEWLADDSEGAQPTDAAGEV